MFCQKSATLACVLAIVLSSIACGIFSTFLTDEAFAELAQETCQGLSTELGVIDDSDVILVQLFEMRATVYLNAAEKMAEFKISEESAPQAFALRTGLTELGDANQNFANALDDALKNVDIKGSGKLTLLTTESGRVMVTAGSIFEITTLDIDPELALSLYTIRDTINESASLLGLEACILK